MESIWPVVLAWPMSKHTRRSVPSTISASCSAVLPRKNGTDGMFSTAMTAPLPRNSLSSSLSDSLARTSALSSVPPTDIDDSPGWTVTVRAPSSIAASTVAAVSLTDASLRMSLRAPGFQSLMGACTWQARPFLSRASLIPAVSAYTL